VATWTPARESGLLGGTTEDWRESPLPVNRRLTCVFG
jgi:hypothetical protein